MQRNWYDREQCRVRDVAYGGLRIYPELEVRRVACRHCGTVKQERLAIRVLQRRAYGLRDEEYLRLKIPTCMLPRL